MKKEKLNTDFNLIRNNEIFYGMTLGEIKIVESSSSRINVISGQVLAKSGAEANEFFIIDKGRVAIQISTPHGDVILQTLGHGDVIGWSWIFEPHIWSFDIRVLEGGELLKIDGEKLAKKCAKDPKMGYKMVKKFGKIIAGRLAATRVRLLDVYGAR